MSDFFNKEENYDVPVTSNYMKFEEGDNRFRILGAFSERTAIQGIEYWKTVNDKRTPVRLRKNPDGSVPNIPVNELETNRWGNLDIPKYFWALPVWNYAVNRVQILEITQKKVLNGIKAYIANPKWGDPRDYDIIVNNTKLNDKAEYTVTVDPKEKLDESIIDSYVAMNINMNALFDGKDPFESVESSIADDAVGAGL